MSHDVRAWLEDLGLGRYAETFAENGVDLDLLPELSNEDLKDLGIERLETASVCSRRSPLSCGPRS